MYRILSVLIGLVLSTGVQTLAYADGDIVKAAYKTSQSNYRGNSVACLQELGIQPISANIHLFQIYLNDFNSSGRS